MTTKGLHLGLLSAASSKRIFIGCVFYTAVTRHDRRLCFRSATVYEPSHLTEDWTEDHPRNVFSLFSRVACSACAYDSGCCYRRSSVVGLCVCLSVCVLVTFVNHTKRLNRSKCRFGGSTHVGSRNHVLDGDKDRTNPFAAGRDRCGLLSKFYDHLLVLVFLQHNVM